MNQWKRLLYYLMLNVLVSACVTLAILMIWDRTQKPTAAPLLRTPTAPAISLALSPSAAVPGAQTPVQPSVPAATPTLTPIPINLDNVIEYQVEEGDTLGTIAERYEVSIPAIMAVNQLSDENSLPVGMVLYIPVTPMAEPPTATATPTRIPASPGGTISPTNPPQEARLIINAVIGPGDLASEHVFITRTGDGELPLANWKLKDEDGNVFIFPQLQLYKDGAVNVWTTSGANTVVDLYWGLSSAVWSSGEKVTLVDSEGKERATYTVP
jgi:LysM repeat protein